jgi:exoribonuclease R
MSALQQDQNYFRHVKMDLDNIERFRKALEEKGVDLQKVDSLIRTARRYLDSGDGISAGRYAKMAAMEMMESAKNAQAAMTAGQDRKEIGGS